MVGREREDEEGRVERSEERGAALSSHVMTALSATSTHLPHLPPPPSPPPPPPPRPPPPLRLL